MMGKVEAKVEWNKVVGYCVILLIVSFALFYFVQIIFGDILHSTLISNERTGNYTVINFVLLLGLFFVFSVSIIANLFLLKDYTLLSKIFTNLIAFISTFVFLYFLAFISVLSIYGNDYLELNFIDKMFNLPLFLAYFAIYVLDLPLQLWLIALLIYSIIVSICLRYIAQEKYKI
jgi:hypothetical protein